MRFRKERIERAIRFLTGKSIRKPEDVELDKLELKESKLYYRDKEVVPYELRNEVIGQLYKDPKNTGGRDRLFEHIHAKYVGISRRDVAAYLGNSEVHQLHAPLPKRLTSRAVTVGAPNRYAQMDLMDLNELKGHNGQSRYVLTLMDVFSKWAAARPLTTKSGPAVEAALLDILPHTNISTIQSDNGSEFGTTLAKKLAEMDIKLIHSSPYNPRANGVIERFNGTLKRTLYRLMDANKTKKWTELLQDVIENYNSTKHRVTGWKPNELKDAKLSEAELDLIYARMTATSPSESETFKRGDTVRLALTTESSERRKGSFRKGYKINWSETLYKVISASKPDDANSLPQYTVKSLDTNRPVGKKLYRIPVATR